MILHLLRMRRNVNRNLFNDGENVSATPLRQHFAAFFTGSSQVSRSYDV